MHADIGSLKSLHTFLEICLYLMQVKFKQNPMVQTTQNVDLVIAIQKKYSLTIYDVPFRSYFWLYRGQTGKNDPILLAMVSKCSSSKYNEK